MTTVTREKALFRRYDLLAAEIAWDLRQYGDALMAEKAGKP